MRLILTLLFSGLMAFGQDNVAAKEDALGRQLSARFTASNPPLADAEVQRYLDQLVHKISNFRVTLIANDPCAALHEATSFPGGSLFVPAALILAAHSESELAGMLAQSIALLSVEAPKESNGGLIFVNLGCAEHQVMRLMDGKSDKEAVQQRVMKADALAMQTLSRAGFNPEGLLSYVQRVQKLSFSVYTALPDRDLRVNQMRLVLQTMPESKHSENDSEFSAAQERLRTLTQIQPADHAVLSAMRMSAPDVYYLRTVHREPVDADLDLVVAIGTSKAEGPIKGDSVYWEGRSPLGIFLQRRDEPATVYKIAISENAENCDAVSVENVTAKDVVLSCMPEKGLPGPNHKFIYDIRSKSLVKEFTFARFELQRTFSADGGAVLVGTNSQRPIAIKYSPGHNPAFRILDSADVRPESKPTPTFGPDNSFSIANGRYGPLVVERTGKATNRYPLPQTSYDEFAHARPARVANGYVRQATIIEEDIGPWQVADGTLWFAKSFYDSEGNSGVGGFGFFDTAQRKFQIFAPPEPTDFSSTAMLVEPKAVWLGLVNHSEYGDRGEGILRFDRATQTAQRIPVPGMITQIARVGSQLLLATDSGVIVIDNGKIHRFFVDETASGKLEITEAALTPQR